MSGLERLAGNKNVARGALRQLSLAELEKLATIFDEIRQEKAEEQHALDAAVDEKKKQLAAIRAQLEALGISPEELKPAKRRPGRPRKSSL